MKNEGIDMGRIKEFKDKEALEKAMILFWKKGYENTSLKDLLSEMDILNGSFYNSYGNKKNLFMKTLDFYAEEVTAKRGALLAECPNFKEGIRLLFQEMFQCFDDNTAPKGCLLVNSISNDLLQDPEIQKYVKTEIDNFKLFFEQQLREAVETKELESTLDIPLTASIIVTYIQGVMRLSNLNYCTKNFRQQTDIFLTALGI